MSLCPTSGMMRLSVFGAIRITSDTSLRPDPDAKNFKVAISRRLGEIGALIAVACRQPLRLFHNFYRFPKTIPGGQYLVQYQPEAHQKAPH